MASIRHRRNILCEGCCFYRHYLSSCLFQDVIHFPQRYVEFLPENQLNLLIGKYESTTEYREAPLVFPIPVIKGPGVSRYCTFLEFNNDNNLVGYTSLSDEGRESSRRCASSSSRAMVSSISCRNPASPTRPMRFYGCHDGNALRRL